MSNLLLSILNRQGTAPTDALDRFVANLPAKPYCSDNPRRRGTYISKREIAVEHAYIQVNAPWRAPFLAVDLDLEEGSAFAAADAGIPDPTFTILNPESSHAHLIWQLDAPVFIGKSIRADWLFNAVRAGLERMLGADTGFYGGLVQNPTHPRWTTFTTGNTFALDDLRREIPVDLLKPRSPINPALLSDVASRNCHLFGIVRLRAYRQIRLKPDHGEFFEWVLEQCCLQNCAYSPPLRYPEVKTVARSISRWTWRHRDNLCAQRRGAMGLSPIVTFGESRRLEILGHRQLAADYGRSARTASVDAKIRWAIPRLERDGRPLTVRAIAKLAGVDRASARRYLRSEVVGSGRISENSRGAASAAAPGSRPNPPSNPALRMGCNFRPDYKILSPTIRYRHWSGQETWAAET